MAACTKSPALLGPARRRLLMASHRLLFSLRLRLLLLQLLRLLGRRGRSREAERGRALLPSLCNVWLPDCGSRWRPLCCNYCWSGSCGGFKVGRVDRFWWQRGGSDLHAKRDSGAVGQLGI